MKECKFEGKTAKKNKRQINGKIAISDRDKTKMMKVMMSVPNKHSLFLNLLVQYYHKKSWYASFLLNLLRTNSHASI